jgi:hypothetical protein
MTNPALRVVPSFAWHMSHLLSLQHDGRGLPRLRSPVVWVLAALKLMLACLVIVQLMPQVGLFVGLMKSLMAVVALYLCASVTRRFYAFSGYLLLWSVVYVGLL